MAQNSREKVKNLFDGKPADRPPFIPWICRFAANLEQVPVRTMLTDAGVLSRALSNAHKLFGYDAILNHFDLSLEAEACGCEIEWQDNGTSPSLLTHPLENGGFLSDLDTADITTKGRIPVMLDATKRLILTRGKEVPVAAMVTGPLSLARRLRGTSFDDDLEQGDGDALDLVEDSGSICLAMCRAYCELGVDIVVLAEDTPEQVTFDISQALSSPLRSITNVAGYYNVKTVLLCKLWNEEQLAPVFGMAVDAFAISGSVENGLIREQADSHNSCVSLPVPDYVFLGAGPPSADLAREISGPGVKGLFLSSEWEVPASTDVNSMHDIMKTVRDGNGS